MFTWSQEPSVSGKVTDEEGYPLPGVTVVVKGTVKGTITNIDGAYDISVASNDVLVFSFIGMKTKELPVSGRSINVVLEDDVTDIAEVQVVAYGAQKKVSITGAISSVDSDELLKSPNASVANTLTGKVTGLSSIQVSGQPGADDPELFIRGQGTFVDASPIYIVDGVERSFFDLDPNEIESISVLKDASATAVYGIRGANGVIIVTTKRGTKGKASFSASVSTGIQQPTRLLKFADSYTYALRFNEAQANDGLSESEYRFQPHVVEAFRTGSDPIMYPNTDWMDYMLKPHAYQHQGNLNVSGGSDKVKYFVSVGILSQDGLFNTFDSDYDYNFSFKRYNYRSNIDIQATNTTNVGVTIGGRVGVKNEPNTQNGMNHLFRNIYWSVPFAGPGIVDGKWIKNNDVYIPGNKKEGLTPFYGRGYSNALNHTLNFDIDIKQDLKKLTKGLKFRLKFAYNTTYGHTKTRSTSKAHYEPFYQAHIDPQSDLFNQYGVVPEDKTIALRRNSQDGTLSYNENYSKARNWYTDFGFNYNRKFGSHNLGGLLLYNQRKTYYPKSSNGGYMNYHDIPTGVVGLVGRVTYDYNTKYLVEFNMGYNGSENFAKESRYGWFPAGSIGWILTEEGFMQNVSFINYLKIRGSYGLVGNDKFNTARFLYAEGPYNLAGGGYNYGIDNPNDQIVAREGVVGYPGVTWETAHKRNIGIDTYFLNSRLAVNVDLFWEDRSDILTVDQRIPEFVAYQVVPTNIGKMKNKGYEVELKWKDQLGSFDYWINANMSHAKNKVIEKGLVDQPEPYMNVTGHPNETPFGYVFDGFFTQDDIDAGNYPEHVTLPMPSPGDMKYKDLNNDGIVNGNDIKALGYSRFPEYIFGLNMGAQFKGFDLSMSWAGATNVTRTLGEGYRQAFGTTQDKSLMQYMADGRWTPENAESATYPRLSLSSSSHNSADSDFWVKDASYMRLKNIEIGYNFKGNFLSGIGIKKLRAYVNGANLLTFDKLEIADPEANTANDSKYPLVKIYNIGVKANF
ncbi:SusC/RagA family TonB-linked outer membrane protein [Marinilabilia rubra]|nr:TonB-dependent receptor [Marinilabilia rubra]